MSELDVAVLEYLRRQDRLSHPAGKQDRGGRWYPAPEERRPCCDRIRPPSRRWPWSLMHHCRTAEHIAQLYNVDRTALLREARAVRQRDPAATTAS